MLVTLRWLPVTPIIAYSAVFISSSILYWFVCRRALAVDHTAKGLLPLLVLLILARASFIGTKPLGSDDVYRYLWDGRVQSAGINPYRYAPDDPALTSLHTERLPALVNHPDLKTLYFPLCEWTFYVGYNFSGEHIWGFQLFILLAEMLTVY
jgi:alpha-1,6-mannosyltransferase